MELTASDVRFDIQVNNPIQLNNIHFSNPGGSSFLAQFYESSVTVGELQFSNSSTIQGNYIGEHVILAPGKFYRFDGGYSYAFNQITAIGNCLANITIEGNETGLGPTALFQSNGEVITLDYVNLKNISASGTSSFTADNSADLGNNSGWTINSRSVQNLYWVGGSGDWSDPNHWSLTSGGPGGACIPSGTDNVFFDVNSFTGPDQRVTISDIDVFCRDMDWTGAAFMPRLDGDYDPFLHIFGSLTMIPEMYYSFGGFLKFESQEIGKTITTGNLLVNKVNFNSSSGEWTLLDSLKVETQIDLTAGSLITNSQYVESTSFSNGNSSLFRSLSLGNTHWVIKHFPGVIKDSWFAELAGFTLDAGTSTIEFKGRNGYFEHSGTGNINYHKVIFNNDVGYLQNFTEGVSCTIDSLQFKHGGYVRDDYTINTILFSPGFTYLFKENTTQSLQEIVAPGNCNQLITIKSDATGNPAYFQIVNSQTDLQYLSLRDIHKLGPGELAAQLSIDLGNNDGWTIDELGNRTLYWVGGTGNWSDQAHWALSSGGPGGECIPTLRDDVIFDNNSFSAPTQEVIGQDFNGYYCRNMTWMDGLPTPNFNLNRLYCHGTAEFGNAMSNQLQHFHMSGDDTHSVSFKGQQLLYTYQDGLGNYTFLDDLNALELILRSGALDMNDRAIMLDRWRLQNENTNLSVDLGASSIELHAGFDNVSHTLEAPYGTNTNITAGSSSIALNHPFASAFLSGGLDFNNLLFTATEGQVQICHAQNSSTISNTARLNLLELSRRFHH